MLEYHRELRKKAEAEVAAFLETHTADIPTDVILREGDARGVILDVAAERDCDLLALGSHGRSGLRHVLIGSVAETVIRASTCDVLVVRPLGLRFELP